MGGLTTIITKVIINAQSKLIINLKKGFNLITKSYIYSYSFTNFTGQLKIYKSAYSLL